jgi:tripartite-type tricarboxylate transporter receptor subunit TctC
MRALMGIFLSLATSSVAATAQAQDAVADFFRGKTFTIIVGSPAGGGYDTYGRAIGRHIGRHLPGNPVVVVQNMPGASGFVAASHVYNVAPKDGLTIATVTQGALLEPLLGDNARGKIDPTRFNYIGSATRDVYVCLSRKDAAVQKFADAFDKELVVGASAEYGSVRDFPLLLNRVLGTKFRIVYGYAGNREITLAVEKGEVQGVCGNSWSGIVAMHPRWFDPAGPVRVLVQEDVVGHPDLNAQGVPKTIDFARTDEQRQAMTLLYDELLFSRPYVMAPGVPADRVAAVRRAFDATVADPQFLADAKRINIEIVDPLTGEKLQALIGKMFATPPAIVEMTRAALRN